MAGGTKNSPKDSTTSLGREEEKDSYKERKNTSNEVRGEVRLDKADAVIDGKDRRWERSKSKSARLKTKAYGTPSHFCAPLFSRRMFVKFSAPPAPDVVEA